MKSQSQIKISDALVELPADRQHLVLDPVGEEDLGTARTHFVAASVMRSRHSDLERQIEEKDRTNRKALILTMNRKSENMLKSDCRASPRLLRAHDCTAGIDFRDAA